ncbi:MAG: hypothetical protein L6R40_001552 [Gallowayella cf. fulva]|nr:MAG: hypothetical protein L6R40_001552 [Xanthomendoza cf. fulva]
MLPRRFLHPILFILSLGILTQQVDIRIERTFLIAGEAESFVAATCLDIFAGYCCKPPTNYPDATTKVLFRHLPARSIAAVWRNDYRRTDRNPTYRITSCAGPLLASRPGPGNWLWRQPASDRRAAEGASYIILPPTLPPDLKSTSWLEWEGLLGLVWSGGKGRWSVDSAAGTLFGSDSGIMAGARRQRDLISKNKGIVYARPPQKVRYPTGLEINGINYLHTQTAQLLYANSDGNVLNLTDWFMDDDQ